MTADRLNQAIQLIKAGKKIQARDFILEAIKSDPKNLNAWLWALEVAANDKEKRVILRKILEIDPSHKAALSYSRRLDLEKSTSDHVPPDLHNKKNNTLRESNSSKFSGVSGLAKLLFDWMASLPSGCFFIAIFVGIVSVLFIYTRLNTGLFGLAGAEFDDLVIGNSYEFISSDELFWEIQFEGIGQTKYLGSVRHVAPIRVQEFSILTHDILVTSGEFSNPSIVNTSVIDHKFFWKSTNTSSPSGTINLIHAIPANKAIYQELLEINKWDTVEITGREILTVKAYQNDETFIGTWFDTGCNTLLVESVTIMDGTEEY
jgi:hypothetical protein